MKKLLLLGLITACSTPAYVVRYDCSPEAKARLADVANTCIGNVKKQGKQEMTRDVVNSCRELALTSLCRPEDHFQYEIPFLGKRPAVRCDNAITFWEKYMCDGV